MNILSVLGIGISLVIGTIIAIVIFAVQHTRNRKYQITVENHFKKIEEALGISLYQDGIPFQKKKEKQEFYKEALALMKDLKYDKAIALLSKYLEDFSLLDNERAAVLNLLGFSYAKISENNRSLNTFKEMLLLAERLNNRDIQNTAYTNIGNCLLSLSRFEDALTAYNMAINLKPNSPVAWNNKGALLSLFNKSEALAAVNKAIDLKRNFLSAWNNKGNILYKLGKYSESLAAFTKAIELMPSDPDAWNRKGLALYRLDKYLQAIIAFNKAVELKPDYSDAWLNIGNTLYKLEKYPEALSALDKAIGLNPNFADAWSGKGIVLDKLEIFPEASSAHDKAIALETNNPGSIYNIACHYSKTKDKTKMLEYINKSITIDPTYKTMARTDKDFRAYWEDPDFKALIGDEAGAADIPAAPRN